MSERKKYGCAPNPCDSCPYAKTTPPGIWDASEYRRLPAWDDPMNFAGTFMCHNQPDNVCRGWMEVHENNMSARMAMFRIDFTPANRPPTKVPLYRSGAEACRAGLSGVRRPTKKARASIDKIVQLRVKREAK